MKNLPFQICLAGLWILSASLNLSAQVQKGNYQNINFFEVKYLTLGQVSLNKVNQRNTYSLIPKFTYDKKGVGIAEIICLPHELKAWQAKVLKVQDSLKHLRKWDQDFKILNPLKLKIATDPATQKKHSIYAFFTPEKNVALESDLQDMVRMPQFPSVLHIFKRDAEQWVLLKKVPVKNWTAYYTLRRAIVLPNN
ncbi:MAG: hypothetical protein V4721_12875 [Bacteroidota bacterium]